MLPDDPPDQNSGNSANNPPPPFGSNFNPHSNPVDPNHPYQPSSPPPSQTPSPEPLNTPNYPYSPNLPDNNSHPSVHSEVAQHRPRDAHGHFLPYEHPDKPQVIHNSQTIPNPPNTPNPPLPSNSSQPSDDDPIFEAKINNPFAKFFNWIKKLIKNEGINIKIKPLTAIGIAVALSGTSGILGGVVGYAFPHSSPILHRSVIYQGNLQNTPNGFVLTLPNSDLYTLRPKAATSINFKSLSNGPVLVKGNLTKEDYVIEVSEIIPLATQAPSITPLPSNPSAASSSSIPIP